MLDFLKKCGVRAFTIIGFIFTFIPDSIVDSIDICNKIQNTGVKTVLIKAMIYIILFIITIIIALLYLKLRKKIMINGHNYTIQIQYGNIFDIPDCKKIIAFDECFTTELGEAPHQIKPTSICGQYLTMNPTLDINALISASGITPETTPSQFQSKTRYESGTIIPNGEFLLMAFAKLDGIGLGHLNRDEYLDCLSLMWKEIDKYYAQNDVCIPILGSGITHRGGDADFTQQELLDLIIYSYQLCNDKIKKPHKLIIVCKKVDGFSLNDICKNI